MHFDIKQLSRVATAFLMAAVFALPQNLLAEGAAHLVSPSASAGLGPQNWLWDLGAQAKLRVFGVGFAFSCGKDLRSGNNAFYVSVR